MVMLFLRRPLRNRRFCLTTGIIICLGGFICYTDLTASKSVGNSVGNASAVKEMTRFAWQGYISLCALRQSGNELAPVTNSCSTASDGLVGPNNLLTVIDSLDTLHLMDLTEEFKHGVDLARVMFSRTKQQPSHVSVFETTIRILGGLLGAFSVSQDPVLLQMATGVGEGLRAAFADGGFPLRVRFGQADDIASRKSRVFQIAPKFNAGGMTNPAEVGSLYLEFAYLAELTGNRKFFDWVERNQRALMNVRNLDGIIATNLVVKSPWKLESVGKVYGVGAFEDSYYEYLVKRCLFDMSPDPSCIRTFTRSLDGIMKHLAVTTVTNHTCITGIDSESKNPKQCIMEHLTCFAGGMFALAYLQNRSRTDWLKFAEDVTETCYLSYLHSPTRLGPEIFKFDNITKMFNATDDKYVLRPETVESIYYLYHVTGNQKYRDWGWNIVLALNSTARTATGFSGLNRMSTNPSFDNIQWSFFIAETLKYLYLLFSPSDKLPMDQWLFSTEAHVIPTRQNPLRQQQSSPRFKRHTGILHLVGRVL